ncbi:MAG: hypothetical protein NVSMB21_24870 [Vulcanimicrobiaceae bacterium]
MSSRWVCAVDPAVHARRLATLVLSGGHEGEPSLCASVVAHGLASRLHRALADGAHVAPLLAWVERTCAGLTFEPRVTAMLATACTNVRPALDGAGVSETLATLDHAIAASLARHAHIERDRQLETDGEIDGTIAAFIVRLDDADPLSAEHSRAVSLWCRRLATRLNLDEEACRFAARSGLLHDVGKARTPLEILHAPRALSDDEWVVMRDHTVAGARMIAEVERLRPFEPAARSHHERLDGKGYPDRLQGDAIPLAIRIVTVADSFNAMIGRRPYRLPMSPALALEQLVLHRESQFDPTVVEAMIDIVQNPVSPQEASRLEQPAGRRETGLGIDAIGRVTLA